MKTQFYDIFSAKDYETDSNGTVEKKTAWHKVGTAWKARASESLNIELYLFPGQRYFLNMKPKEEKQDFDTFVETTL